MVSRNNPLMSFKHLRMLNSASKNALKLHLLKFSKPEKTFKKKKKKLMGDIPLESFEGGTYPPSPLWQKPWYMHGRYWCIIIPVEKSVKTGEISNHIHLHCVQCMLYKIICAL
jgi:hypothetical protein